jgi:DNA-binding CsgD family transcriptional regulator
MAPPPAMQLQQFMDISQAPDLALFERRLIDFAHWQDFGIVTATLVVERVGFGVFLTTIGNVPQGISQHMQPGSARRDPVIRRLKRLSIPFVYDQALYVNEDASDMWEEQAPLGFHTGVAVALHLPAGRHFLIGFDREAPLPPDEAHLARLFADLQLVAVHAQEAAARLMSFENKFDAPATRIQLTRREAAVLQWAMNGKTSAQIGDLLHVSERTVNFHAGNAMTKLGCQSRTQACMKALRLRLIS